MSEQQTAVTKQKRNMQEQQQTQQQLQSQQQPQINHQPQQQTNKCMKEQPVIGCNIANTVSAPAATTANNNHKSNIHEMRNQDYISRLMAATPPYLYSAPVGQNFFFSDMLRALVQARQNENVRHLQLQQQHQQQQHQQQQAALLARRPRKRLWSQNKPYYEQLRERKDNDDKQTVPTNGSINNAEKPLELTNKTYFQLAHAYHRKVQQDAIKELGKFPIAASDKNNETNAQPLSEKDVTTENPDVNMQTPLSGGAVDSVLQDTPPAASLPPQDLVLPPPPPVWYPSMYPPYAFDPLHFFIDLRVSGHIYDRKKENVSPLSNSTDNNNSNSITAEVNTLENNQLNIPNKRHGSAFTVPTPRNELKNVDALNLSAAAAAAASSTFTSKLENYGKYYDMAEAKENNHPFTKHSASYMLQHLPRLYSQFAARDLLQAGNDQHILGDTDGSSVNNLNDNISYLTDNKSDCDGADSEGQGSIENSLDNISNREIDVEIIDSIKYRTDAESSHCSSPDDASITQID